jgi:small subunit ribosomal protein S12
MPTIQQLVRSQRIQIKKKNKMSSTGKLSSATWCLYARYTTTLRNNSAIRKVARVRLTSGFEVTAYIPGIITYKNILLF